MAQELYISGISQVKAYRILQAQVAGVIKAHGFGSVTEWFVLSYVARTENAMAKDAAALLQVEAPLITRLVDSLQQRDLVKTVQHPHDKRARYIWPTKKALRLIPKVQTDLETALRELLDGVDPGDMQAYQRVLETIIKNGGSV